MKVTEEEIWSGKPFNWGLPSFTSYRITSRRIIIEKGILTKKREEIQLYRVRDIAVKRSLIERMLKFGDITIYSTDASSPTYTLRNIRDSIRVTDLLGLAAEEARLRHKALELTEVQG